MLKACLSSIVIIVLFQIPLFHCFAFTLIIIIIIIIIIAIITTIIAIRATTIV